MQENKAPFTIECHRLVSANVVKPTLACKQVISFISFFFLIIANLAGQPKCKVEYYSTERGLSHQRVTTIIKDKQGFMWFGSWDGINRFDGRSFASYKSSPGDKLQLGNDRIDRI